MQELLNFEYRYLGLMFGTSWLNILFISEKEVWQFQI
jgi:hypothetical protein